MVVAPRPPAVTSERGGDLLEVLEHRPDAFIARAVNTGELSWASAITASALMECLPVSIS